MNQETLTVLVRKKTRETAAVCSFELAAPDGVDLPAFTAGAHLDVHIGDGLVRQYSIASHPGDRSRYLIAVQQEVNGRGGSRFMHEHVNAGDLLEVSLPRNHFPLHAGAQRSILIAGGIGITPIISMAEFLSAESRSFALHYLTREPALATFSARLSERQFSKAVTAHYSGIADTKRPDLSALIGKADTAAHLYVCGPASLIDAVISSARALGWDEEHIHHERFASVAPDVGQQEFRVQIASTGQFISVLPGQTVVEAMEQVGVPVMTSCGQGICGTCVTKVLSGLPDHHDLYLSDAEKARNDCFTPCCSRSRSPLLVLDL